MDSLTKYLGERHHLFVYECHKCKEEYHSDAVEDNGYCPYCSKKKIGKVKKRSIFGKINQENHHD